MILFFWLGKNLTQYLVRVDFHIPGADIVGGYSMCSSPLQLEKNKTLELAVKYSTHPPAHWIHTQVKYAA